MTDLLRSVLGNRELLGVIVRRDLSVRYKQAVVGAAWAVVAPLASMLVFTLVFTRAVTVETAVPYPLFAYSGLVLWGFLASSLRSATTSLTGNHALVTKVRFPRAVLPIAAVLTALVDFAVASLLLAGLMLLYGVAPGPTVILLPVVLLAYAMLVGGLALWLAAGHLFYRDVGLVFGLVIGLWMFLTSVVYPVEAIGGRIGDALAHLNPLNPLFDSFRAALFGGPFPGPLPLLYALAWTAALLISGVALFRRLEPWFAEAI
jgi:ABC-type polysaccharide/polyol phosphate export permease